MCYCYCTTGMFKYCCCTAVYVCRDGRGCLYTVIQWKPPLAFYKLETRRTELSSRKRALCKRQWAIKIMQSCYDDITASSYAAIGETPFSMTSFLTNGCLLNNGLRGEFQAGTLPAQAAQQDCDVRGTMWHRCVRTRKASGSDRLGAGLAELCPAAHFVLHVG